MDIVDDGVNIPMPARPGRFAGGPTHKGIPAGFTQTERKIATLYPPVDPSLISGLLSNGGMPAGMYPGCPQREVRVRLGKIEVWEKVQS